MKTEVLRAIIIIMNKTYILMITISILITILSLKMKRERLIILSKN